MQLNPAPASPRGKTIGKRDHTGEGSLLHKHRSNAKRSGAVEGHSIYAGVRASAPASNRDVRQRGEQSRTDSGKRRCPRRRKGFQSPIDVPIGRRAIATCTGCIPQCPQVVVCVRTHTPRERCRQPASRPGPRASTAGEADVCLVVSADLQDREYLSQRPSLSDGSGSS